MTIQELIDKRNKLNNDMRAMLDKHPEGMNAEQEQRFSAMEQDFEQVSTQIKRMEAQQRRDAQLDAMAGKPLVGDDAGNEPRDMAAYKEAFFAFIKHGASGISSEHKNVLKQFKAAGLESGTGNKGGYLVPTLIANEIITGLNAKSWIRSLANVYGTASTTDIPVDASIPAFGWMDEKAAFAETDLTFGKVTIGAHKIGGIIRISEELLEDSAFDLESHLQRKIIAGFESAEEQAFLAGTGTGQPTGILTSAGTGVTTAGTSAITADEVMDFVYSVSARYRENAQIVASSDFVKVVRKLKDGNGQYIWEPNYKAGEPDTLLGKPLRESEFMPAVATGETPAVIADFRYFDIADRGGMYMQRLVEKYADTGEVGFRTYKRTDAKLTIADAAKTLKMA